MSLASILPPSSRSERKKGPRLLTPNTNSIPLIDPLNGPIYSLIHTAAVIGLFVAQFSALVADPYWVMIWDVGPLMILQCLYYVFLTPVSGTWTSTTRSSGHDASDSISAKGSRGPSTGSLRRRLPTGGRTNAAHSGWLSGKLRATLFAIALTVLLPPVPLTVVAHVLGAPLYPPELILNTAILSLHVSLLTCFPLFYTHGVSGPAWRDVAAAWLPFDEAGVWGGCVGCVVGGWLGAIPMALDWDRDWQAWPVTVLVGCYGGWALGKTLMGPIFLQGRRIDMSVESESEPGPTQGDEVKNGKKLV